MELSLLLSLCILHLVSSQNYPLHMAHIASNEQKTGKYIISAKDSVSSERLENLKEMVSSMSEDCHVKLSDQGLFANLIASKMSQECLARKMAQVNHIEEYAHAAFHNVPYHLDRLDQHRLPLDNSYNPMNNGEGVDVYLLDSGIRYDHQEFEGRAHYSGYDPIDELTHSNRRGADCLGHGTWSASLIGGKTFGVANKVQIYSVRVFDCNGKIAGNVVTIIKALNYVRDNFNRARPTIVVLNVAWGGIVNLGNALSQFRQLGIPVVAAAGNIWGQNACNFSPAANSNHRFAIIAGGSTRNDQILPGSGIGPCVDILAPGEAITGAVHTCPSCNTTQFGTSASTPLVGGVVAIIKSANPHFTVDQVRFRLFSDATVGVVDTSHLPFATTDRLLHTPPALIEGGIIG